LASTHRIERAPGFWGSAARVAAVCAVVCCAVLGHCLTAQAAVTRTGTLDATVAENLRTGQSTTRYTLRFGGERTVVRPTEIAADPGDRVAVTGAVREGRLVGTVEAISPSTQAAVAPGPHKTAVILFTFPGEPTSPWSANEVRSKVFTGAASVSDFYEEESYGDVSLTGKLSPEGDVFGWLQINSPTAGCPYGEWRLAADDAAAEAGIDLGGYDHLIYMFPRQSSCTWEGIEGVAANGMMLNGNQSVQVIAHEMGHSLGLQHAGSWTCMSGGARVQISDDCTMTQYGDPFDIMGNIAVRHSNGEGLEKLGFLAPENVKTVHASGVYQLHSALHPTSEPTVLRIRRKTTLDGETSFYYLEVREGGGIFENVSDATTSGVSIRVTGESYTPETLLIDANPATATFQDAPLGVGQTFEGGPVRITTQSAGGGNASVSVTLDEAPPTPPTALTASAEPGGVSLKWHASSDNFGVDRYVVLRDGSEIGNPSGMQFHDSDATVGDHTYRVIAEDEVGNRSAPSGPATATVERDEVPPTAPAELTATPEVDGVWLEWEASDDDYGVERYVVFRDGSEIATTTHNELIDSSPAAGEHTYLVYAEDRAENRSDGSVPATATLAAREGPYCESGTCTVSFWHTGAPANWTVPPGVSQAKFTVEGAEGGGENPASRSQGARAVAKIASLSSGEQFAVIVGGAGSSHTEGGFGGFGGGGDGTLGAGGGGYSSVSRGSTLTLLAGGGGGAGLAGFNASTGEEPGGGSGGSGGEGAPGSPGIATLSQEATLGGGAGGASGEGGGPGGGGGTATGTSACPETITTGAPGAAGASLTGGGGAPGAGGGGGGGYVGGGQGGGGAFDLCGGEAGAGGGGGGSSFAADGISATFTAAFRRGFGQVKISYSSPVTATEHNYITGPGQALVVPAAEGALSGASGPDGLPLTISLFVPPPFGSVELEADGSFTYTPPPGHLGGDYFDFVVTDPAGSYAVGRVMVEIAAPPSASISGPATGGSYVVGQSVPTAFSCTEGEGGTGLASCNDSSGKKTASGGSGHLDTSAVGSHAYTVTAVSSDGLSDSESIEYTVVPAPKPPEEPERPPEEPKQPPVAPKQPPEPPVDPPHKVEISLSVEQKSLRDLLRTRKLVVATSVSEATDVALVGRAKLRVGVRGDVQTKLVAVFARKTVTFPGPGKREVTLVLSREGREALRDLPSLRLTIAGRASTEAGEAASRTVAVTLTR
jgi:hypothetical protein